MVLPFLLHCAVMLPPLPSNAHPRKSLSCIFQDIRVPKGVGGFSLTLAKQSNSHWNLWSAGVRITGLSFWPFSRKSLLLCMSHMCLVLGWVNTGIFPLLFFCDYADYCLPALWEVCGLVGIWCAALWDVGWPGKIPPPVLCDLLLPSKAALIQGSLKV